MSDNTPQLLEFIYSKHTGKPGNPTERIQKLKWVKHAFANGKNDQLTQKVAPLVDGEAISADAWGHSEYIVCSPRKVNFFAGDMPAMTKFSDDPKMFVAFDTEHVPKDWERLHTFINSERVDFLCTDKTPSLWAAKELQKCIKKAGGDESAGRSALKLKFEDACDNSMDRSQQYVNTDRLTVPLAVADWNATSSELSEDALLFLQELGETGDIEDFKQRLMASRRPGSDKQPKTVRRPMFCDPKGNPLSLSDLQTRMKGAVIVPVFKLGPIRMMPQIGTTDPNLWKQATPKLEFVCAHVIKFGQPATTKTTGGFDLSAFIETEDAPQQQPTDRSYEPKRKAEEPEVEPEEDIAALVEDIGQDDDAADLEPEPEPTKKSKKKKRAKHDE
jgi:hypothetical protein